jgi:hypothetical protein
MRPWLNITHDHGYWHGRNGFPCMASDADYQSGYRAGVIAASKAPPPPHHETETLEPQAVKG